MPVTPPDTPSVSPAEPSLPTPAKLYFQSLESKVQPPLPQASMMGGGECQAECNTQHDHRLQESQPHRHLPLRLERSAVQSSSPTLTTTTRRLDDLRESHPHSTTSSTRPDHRRSPLSSTQENQPSHSPYIPDSPSEAPSHHTEADGLQTEVGGLQQREVVGGLQVRSLGRPETKYMGGGGDLPHLGPATSAAAADVAQDTSIRR